MKKLLFSLMAIILTIINTNAQTQPYNSIKTGDIVYRFNEDNSVSKYIGNAFAYDIIYKGYEAQYSEDSNTFTGTNPKTGEFYTVYNIREKGEFITFDIKTSEGSLVKDITMRFNLKEIKDSSGDNITSRGGGWGIGLYIVDKILDTVSDLMIGTTLQQCTEAMAGLNCGDKTAYMVYTEGNWFSKASCEVGCR